MKSWPVAIRPLFEHKARRGVRKQTQCITLIMRDCSRPVDALSEISAFVIANYHKEACLHKGANAAGEVAGLRT